MKKIIPIILFILIVLIQTIGIIYATNKREYYHIDEYYSHGLMQYKRAFIFENEDFSNEWHSKEYFKDYLTISENEKFDLQPIYYNQAEDVHPPIYYLLLHIACSFNINQFSIWPGTILNIIIFIISSIFLFLISKEIFKNSYYALLVCFVTGFSIATIETVMYVRMYELLILNILMLIYWHIRKKQKKNLTYKDLLPLYAMIIFGFLTHYYYCIIVATLFAIYLIKFIKKKEYKNMILYIFTVISSALTGIILFPYSVFHIFFSYRGEEVGNNLINFSNAFIKIKENFALINHEVLHNYGYILLAIIVLFCFLWIFFKRKEKQIQEEKGSIIYVVIPLIVYLVIIIFGSPYIDLRYIMPAVPLIFCSLIYVMNDILQDILSTKKAFFILLTISICFSISVIPRLSNNSYTYKGHKEVLNYIEDNLEDKPWIYVYEDISVQYNKTMECYEALTKANMTYIMQSDIATAEHIEKTLEDIDKTNGIVIMMNYAITNDVLEQVLKTELFNDIKYIGVLGRYQIYLLN